MIFHLLTVTVSVSDSVTSHSTVYSLSLCVSVVNVIIFSAAVLWIAPVVAVLVHPKQYIFDTPLDNLTL